MNSQNVTLSKFALEQLMITSSELGANTALTQLGLRKEYLSQSAAQKRFGKRTIDRWRTDGKIEPVKQSGIIKYKVNDLERLSKVNELHNKFIEKV